MTNSSKPVSQSPSGEEAMPTCDKQFHMYVWTREPFFYAVAQARSVDEARKLMLEEIGSGDGSCPERMKAEKWVQEIKPYIFHRENATFALTDSAEQIELGAYIETLQKKLKESELRQGSPTQLAYSQPELSNERWPKYQCEGCGVAAPVRSLPLGWTQYGESKRRIPGQKIGLACWCEKCSGSVPAPTQPAEREIICSGILRRLMSDKETFDSAIYKAFDAGAALRSVSTTKEEEK